MHVSINYFFNVIQIDVLISFCIYLHLYQILYFTVTCFHFTS